MDFSFNSKIFYWINSNENILNIHKAKENYAIENHLNLEDAKNSWEIKSLKVSNSNLNLKSNNNNNINNHDEESEFYDDLFLLTNSKNIFYYNNKKLLKIFSSVENFSIGNFNFENKKKEQNFFMLLSIIDSDDKSIIRFYYKEKNFIFIDSIKEENEICHIEFSRCGNYLFFITNKSQLILYKINFEIFNKNFCIKKIYEVNITSLNFSLYGNSSSDFWEFFEENKIADFLEKEKIFVFLNGKKLQIFREKDLFYSTKSILLEDGCGKNNKICVSKNKNFVVVYSENENIYIYDLSYGQLNLFKILNDFNNFDNYKDNRIMNMMNFNMDLNLNSEKKEKINCFFSEDSKYFIVNNIFSELVFYDVDNDFENVGEFIKNKK
jgi:hypothetical protein